jgi:hypothetical protein
VIETDVVELTVDKVPVVFVVDRVDVVEAV